MPASHNTTTPITDVNYKTPPFPSLYWLIGPANVVKPAYLFHERDIWRFTLYWTLIIYEAAHLLVASYAVVIVWWGGRNDLLKRGDKGEKSGVGRWRKLKALWMVPVVYGIVGGVEALVAGSVVGLL